MIDTITLNALSWGSIHTKKVWRVFTVTMEEIMNEYPVYFPGKFNQAFLQACREKGVVLDGHKIRAPYTVEECLDRRAYTVRQMQEP